MDRITLPPPVASEHIAPALAWAERNLSTLARYTAAKMNGGDGDHLHLSATMALLRARQAVRAGIREAESPRMEGAA
ncbi:MAG: hypothetical protein WD851_19620 [Pirellulales bacterium]